MSDLRLFVHEMALIEVSEREKHSQFEIQSFFDCF
jgi:hypothetical protein